MARYVTLPIEGGSKVAFNPDHVVWLRQDPGVTTTAISTADGERRTVILGLEEAVARLQGDPKDFKPEELLPLLRQWANSEKK
jgi:hypothetical protein